MTLKLNGTNSEAAPAYAGDDADTGLQCGTNELKLVTGGTARATVDSSGNMGLGTTSPNSQSGYTSLTLNHATNGSILDLRKNDTALSGGRLVGFANEFGLESRSQASGSQISFYVNNAYTGRWTVDGLCFGSDTAATNALNDYEEGDWTPTMSNGGWTGFTINSAKYIKIGALVFVQCFVGPLTGSGNGGALKLGGLPFNSITSGYTAGTVDFGEGGVKGNYCRTESNDPRITFYYPSESNTTTRYVLAGNQIGDNYIIINLTYFTNA